MTDQELVKRCLHEICMKSGFDTPSAMAQRDFEHISREVEENTGILLSISTIKRLSHGEFSRIPQIATLNAIANYLGFKNWQEYKTSIRDTVCSSEPGQKGEEAIKMISKIPKSSQSVNWKWISIASVVVGIIVFFSFISLSINKNLNYDKAKFSAKKTTDNAMPNTVIFNYNIDDVHGDSFFIQQSWDKRRRVKIEKHNYTLTDIYYEPGYHRAKLIANDSIIKTVDVSIPTDRWFLFAKGSGPKTIPEYIKEKYAFKNGYFGLAKTDLDSNQIKTDEEKIFVYEYFPGKMDVSSDNFTFKTRVRMKEVRNNQCPYIMYEIFCQKYFMYFKSMSKGCASEEAAQFGENELNGKNVDLSSLCSEINQWTDVELMVKNKVATVSFNNQKAYTAAYNNSSGLITGLGFISNGLCEIEFVSLKGVYEHNFTDNNNQIKAP